MRRLALLTALLALFVAGPAAAATVTGESADPADGAGSPAQDVERAWASVDTSTGALSAGIRLRAPAKPEEGGWAALHGVLYDSGSCAGTELGRLEASTHPDRPGVAFGAAGTPVVAGTRTVSADGRELQFALTAPGLAGREAGCLLLSLSRKRPLDMVAVALRAPGTPAGDAPPAGGAQPPVIVLAADGVPTLRVSRTGTTRVLLRGFLVPVTLRARAVRRPGGRVLLRGTHAAGPRRPVAVPLRLTRAGRRALAGRRSLRVRLTITARTPGAPEGVRTVPVKLERR